MNIDETIRHICNDYWKGDYLPIHQKNSFINNPSFTTREGLELQAKYANANGVIYALVQNSLENPDGTAMLLSDKGSKNDYILKTFKID